MKRKVLAPIFCPEAFLGPRLLRCNIEGLSRKDVAVGLNRSDPASCEGVFIAMHHDWLDCAISSRPESRFLRLGCDKNLLFFSELA
jgi:hypothetical protein